MVGFGNEKLSDNRRNRASRNEMMEIVLWENTITAIIESGLIKSYNELIEFLGKEWKKKWGNLIDRIMK